jgi:protein SCO1/2
MAPTRLALLTALALGFAALAGIAIGAVAWLSLPAAAPPSSTSAGAIWPVSPTPEGLERDTRVRPAAPAPSLQLTNQDGRPFDLASLRGRPVLLSFGYTHCPDVCPTTLSELAAAMEKLGPAAKDVQVLFVTVDPARDTPALLGQYVPAFNPSFVGLYGDAAALERTAKEFRVLYQKQEGQTPESYTMDHSAGTFVFDPKGRLRLYVGYGQGADVFAHDLGELLRTAKP